MSTSTWLESAVTAECEVIETVTLVSDGTEELPYCSWAGSCEWGDAMKDECADALCAASGYESGTFIDSDVDACEESSTSEEVWMWITDEEEYRFGAYWGESVITAECE